jgi:type I restriction enzyme M protein
MSKTNTKSFSSLAAFIWSVADTLKGDFKQTEHGVVVLAFGVLRVGECA